MIDVLVHYFRLISGLVRSGPVRVLTRAFDDWVGPTLPLLTEVLFLLFFPLCLIVHKYYFLCHFSVFSLNFTIVLRRVLLLNFDRNRQAHIQSIPGRIFRLPLY